MTDKKSVTSKISSGSGFESQSVNTIPFEYNVKTEQTTCCSLCSINLFISIILFTFDILFECFIIIQWINNKYYIPILILLIFIFISNLGNLFQWYIQFNDYTTFKLCHLIIPFGLIGFLPLFSIIYYICHSSCCLCARIGLFSNAYYNQSISSKHTRKKIISHKSNDISERLLQPPLTHSITDIDSNKQTQNDIYNELLTNITQLLCLQSFIRTVPFVCIELYVLITTKFEPNNLILTHWNDLNININIPNELLINNDLNLYYYLSVSIGLITYAFITLTCLDLMEEWQQNAFPLIMNTLLKLFHIIFIFCDCIIRIMPIILIFQCKDTIEWYYIIFGLQIVCYLEIIIWYEIYQYYPDFPMRKIYPFTYNSLHNKYEHIIESTVITSHIAMQSQTNKRNNFDHNLPIEHSEQSSPKQYENPRYISNGLNNETNDVIILSPVSAASDELNNINISMENEIKDDISLENNSKIWVPKNLEPHWKIEKDEYISALQGLFGGILTCISGWLIGYTLRHCIINKQYKLCIIELIFRYILSIGVIIIYGNEYQNQLFKYKQIDNKYWIWIVIFIGCVGCNVAYILIIHLIYKPTLRKIRLNNGIKN